MKASNRLSPTSRFTSMATLYLWMARGFWGVADQIFFAGSTFLMDLLLARWLPPSEYGAFAVALSAFYFPAAVYMALLADPMMVYGGRRYQGLFGEYIEALLGWHWKLSVVVTSVLLVVGGVLLAYGSQLLGDGMMILAFASPFILMQWLLRVACYMKLDPRLASLASLQYLVVTLAGLAALRGFGALSVQSVLALVGAASLGTAVWLGRRLRVRVLPLAHNDLFRGVSREHWEFGRWSVAAAALTWITSSAYFVILPLVGDLEDAGAYRALFNLLLPLVKVATALGPVLLSAFVAAHSGRESASRTRVAAVAFLVGGTAYWLLLAVGHRPLMTWLYAGRYDRVAPILIWFAAAAIFISISKVAESALRAIERPDYVFWANLVSAAVALVVGLVVIPKYGVVGAAAGFVASSFAFAATLFWQLLTRIGRAGQARPVQTGPE